MIVSIHGILASISKSGSLILDTVTASSSAAYSLRKLRTAYNGNCIRVRRSSDNTELDIGFLDNQLDTVALLAFVGASNGFVTTWYDQSIASLNATQATAANQPRIVNAGVVEVKNNRPTIAFLGSQRLQTPALFNHPGQLSNFSVGFYDVNARWIYQIGATNTFGALFIFQPFWTARTGASNTSVGGAVFGILDQISTIFSATNTAIFRRGVSGATLPFVLGASVNQVLSIGDNASGSNLIGGIPEIIFYSSTLTTADQQLLETNQQVFYNMFVLDSLVAIPSACFSVRKLRIAYTGNCMRVRRSSDNTELDIGFVNNELDTVGLLAFVGSASGFVANWYDQSGNGRNALHVVASRQPRIVDNGVLEVENGKPTVVAFGSQLLATLQWGSIPHPFTRNYVLADGGLATGWLVQNAIAGINTVDFKTSTTTLQQFSGGSGPNVTVTTTPQVISSIYNTTSSNFRRNGTPTVNGNSGNQPFNGIALFANGNAANNSYTGKMAEFVVFPSLVTTPELQALERNQGVYYGITVI